VRFLVVVGLLALFAFLGVLASSSCVLATRDLPDGSDAGAPPSAIATASEADIDCGCCAPAVLPLLPLCSGKVAFVIPAGDCPRLCMGALAYALCEGTCYSDCACALPEQYSLIDGGFILGEGGGDEAPGEASGEIGDAARVEDAGDSANDTGIIEGGFIESGSAIADEG
jgi:hypothetical protein